MASFFTYPINRFGVRLTIISFSIGTVLFLLHLAFSTEITLTIGFVYVVLALGINSITFLFILLHTMFTYKDIKEHSMVILLMLVNIPIAYSYLTLITI